MPSLRGHTPRRSPRSVRVADALDPPLAAQINSAVPSRAPLGASAECTAPPLPGVGGRRPGVLAYSTTKRRSLLWSLHSQHQRLFDQLCTLVPFKKLCSSSLNHTLNPLIVCNRLLAAIEWYVNHSPIGSWSDFEGVSRTGA